MTINLSKLKELAEAAKRDPYDHLAANDYGMSMPPATALELIAEIEHHRQVNAEGCKPDLNEPIHPDDMRAIVEQHREFMKLTDHEWMDNASTLQDRAYALGRARGKAEQNMHAEQHQGEPAGEIVAFGHGLHGAAVEHGLDKAEGCKPDLINQPFFYALAGPDGKPHYDDFCVADSPADLECHEEGITIIPLYTRPAAGPGEVERLVAANTEYARRHLEQRGEIERLRAELTDIQPSVKHWMKRTADQRAQLTERDALLRELADDVLFVAPSYRQRAEALLAASAEPLNDLCAEGSHEFVPFRSVCVKCGEPYSAEPSAPKYPRVEIVRAHKHTCASCKEGVNHGPCDCGAIIDGVAVTVEPTDVQLIEIARKAAVDSVHRYFYMPTTTEDAKSWEPHRWVIEAMRAAVEHNS